MTLNLWKLLFGNHQVEFVDQQIDSIQLLLTWLIVRRDNRREFILAPVIYKRQFMVDQALKNSFNSISTSNNYLVIPRN